MSLPSESDPSIRPHGGCITIRFPYMNVDMSVDNETELAAAYEMLQKCLEIHETNQAKMTLVQSIQEEEQRMGDERMKQVQEAMKQSISSPRPPPTKYYTHEATLHGKFE